MAGLSRAARGYKRGALETLIDPPALFHESVDMTMRNDSKIVFYSYPTIVLFGGISWLLSALSVPFALVFLIPVAIALLAVVTPTLTRSHLYSDVMSDHLRKALKSAAEDAVDGKDVSIAEYIAEVLPEKDMYEYLNDLTYAQRKWLDREWEMAFARASEKVKKELNSLTPTQRAMIQDDVDSMLDKNEVRRIAQQRKALAELRSLDQKNLEEIKNTY